MGYAIQGNVSNCKMFDDWAAKLQSNPQRLSMGDIHLVEKKKDQPKNMRENDARKTIRVAFQEVFQMNFQEKEHLEWEASFQHGRETDSEFASEK